MINRDANRQTVEAFWLAISAKDVEAYLALFAEDAIAHDPACQPPQTSQEARRANMQGILDGFASLSTTVDFITHCGVYTASKWTVTGKSRDGVDIVLEGIDVIRHDAAGLIAEMWGYFDAG